MKDGDVPALIVGDGERRRVSGVGNWSERLIFCSRIADLQQCLTEQQVAAILIETRDADGAPVPAAIGNWVEQNPRVPVVVWTAGSASALSEILDLSAVGGDVRLILRPRDDLASALQHLLSPPTIPHRGAVPALLKGVVLGAPPIIRPELTLAAYHAWPFPAVHRWAQSLNLTRQALNRRLGAAQLETASIIMDYFSAAEIAIRLTLGMRLKQVAAAMARPDERSLRRRLERLAARPEHLRDESDFRALIPRIASGIRQPTSAPHFHPRS